jgi:serine/threonine-protein kinase
MGKKLPRSDHSGMMPGKDDKEAEPNTPPVEADDAEGSLSEERSWEELGSTQIVGAEMPQAGSAPLIESRTLGDFQLIKKLGEGAMGAVYKARQLSFDRLVALKILFPHVANIPKLVERLYREGRVMGQLDHPNIVQAYAVDEVQGRHCVAMEYIDGHSMQRWLTRVNRLSPADAVHVILACARALAYAHQNGVIHRDIKPDNILVTRSGVVKVADLGMVKTFDEDMSLTQTGHAVGTPWYMPLEQARNAKEIDCRCDIYALGCTLYCLLVGNPPFTGRTIVEVIQAKELGTFPPARQFNQDVPERLDLVLVKMVHKHPKHRYQTCDELIKDLETLQIASKSLDFLTATAAPASKTVTPTPVDSSAEQTMVASQEDPNQWFVVFKTSDGQSVTRKYTTAQLQRMLGDGTVNASAKASRTMQGIYRSLATYKEFNATALAKVTKKGADKNTARYRNLYKQIEEKEQKREGQDKNREERQQSMALAGHWLKIAFALGAALAFIILLGWFLHWVATGLTGS